MADRTDTKRSTTITRKENPPIVTIGDYEQKECELCDTNNLSRCIRKNGFNWCVYLCDDCIKDLVEAHGKK